MSHHVIRASLVVLGFLVSACAQSTRPESMVAPLTTARTMASAVDNSIMVGEVAGGQETNPMWTSQISTDSFRMALQQSLVNYQLHSPTGPYRLNAVLVNVDQPFIGFDMTVTTTVNYTLLDPTGNEVWSKGVTAPYTATMSDAFLGVERLRLANEGSAKENIRRALEAMVEEIDGTSLLVGQSS